MLFRPDACDHSLPALQESRFDCLQSPITILGGSQHWLWRLSHWDCRADSGGGSRLARVAATPPEFRVDADLACARLMEPKAVNFDVTLNADEHCLCGQQPLLGRSNCEQKLNIIE